MKHPRSRFGLFMVLTLLMLVFALSVAVVYARPDKDAEKNIVGEPEFLGMVTFETGTEFQGTEVGGLSGITYDASRGVYYVVSDDRSETNDARYYTAAIDLSDGSLDDGDVEFLSYTTLLDENGQPFATDMIDAEGIALRASGQVFISSEWRTGSDPFVKRFDWDGFQTATLPIPDKFMPGDDSGMHANFAFESLAITPDDKSLWTASEAALKQDGEPSSPTTDSPARMLMFDAPKRRPMAEYVYVVDAIPNPPTELPPPCCDPDNGLVELVAVDNVGTLLAMERSWWHRYGNTVELFEVKTAGATDVSGCFSLDEVTCEGYEPVSKRSVLELTPDSTPRPDNLEGATFGPMLDDGRYLLILVSDNNFNSGQTTQFIAYAVEVD